MTATSGIAGSGDPDMALIGELLEEITRSPPAIGARKLLVEHYMAVGWLEAALDHANELKALAPGDADVTDFLQVLQKKPEPPALEKKPASIHSRPVVEARVWDPKTGQYAKAGTVKQNKKASISSSVNLNDDLEPARRDLTQGYQVLRAKARFVIADLLNLQALQRKAGLPQSANTKRVQAIAGGGTNPTFVTSGPPGSARSVARSIKDSSSEATPLAITDLEGIIIWMRSQSSGTDDDAVRDVLVKRVDAVQSALPDDLKVHCELALMHVEHEYLKRNYVNTETMLGDEVKDIPRAKFYVTEDNYAWDMEELVQAIRVGKGIMRNPLSKEMFTPKDIRGILVHPLGKSMAALAVEQHELSKGVRTATIVEMEKLAHVLLEDQSSDTLPSRKAVDEFLAYIATRKLLWALLIGLAKLTKAVPVFEQKAIEHLKCPARDSHTGQAYDFTISEAVLDAKGNRVCFHKTGDFIKQAAAHLKQSQGVAADPDKCRVM
jgi:hypothetical protein